jgi:DNA primase
MEIIEQIRQVANIVELASSYTTLKKRGSKQVGLCPFHSEKTPSFTVDETKQLFHCFGCGAGGDVFSLVMQKENFTFPEAIKFLAEKYHVPLPQQTRVSPQVLKLEERILKINEMALVHFSNNLARTKEGEKALDYLKKRDITEKTIEELKIGYAQNAWDATVSYFRGKNVPDELLEKAGLALPGQKGKGSYDRFRGRIIFPIFSQKGKVLAFGGRTIFEADPKYLNSPETLVYSKGKEIYGLNLSLETVRQKGEIILVEGYMDFASLFQAGIKNCAASLGTALTQNQVYIVRRFATRIILNYDGDTAGLAAAGRAVSLCFESGIRPRVLVLPEKCDPDLFIRKYGPERYLKLSEKSRTGLEFLISTMKRSYKLDVPEDKARLVSALMREIDKIPDAVTKSEYLRQMSNDLNVDEKLLRGMAQQEKPVRKDEDGDPFLPAEKRLLQILAEGGTVGRWIASCLKEDDVTGLKGEPLFRFLLDSLRKDKGLQFQDMQQAVGAPLASQLSRVLFEKQQESTELDAGECIKSLRRMRLENRLKELQREIVRVEKRGEKEKLAPLLYQRQSITKEIMAL